MAQAPTYTKGHLQPVCGNCGNRHFAWSHTNASCTHQLKVAAWQHSAAGISALAAQAREDGERHYGKAVRSDGTVSEWRLEEARKAFALAAQYEGVTA